MLVKFITFVGGLTVALVVTAVTNVVTGSLFAGICACAVCALSLGVAAGRDWPR